MATGSRSNPILIDCGEARVGARAGRCYHNPLPSSEPHTLRARQKRPRYCLRDLFSPKKYGICQGVPREELRWQCSRSIAAKARCNGISAQPRSFEELSRSKTTKLTRRKLTPSRSYSAKPCCSCTEDEGCTELCQNRAMCYSCDEDNCRVGPGCTNRPAYKVEARCKVLSAGGKGFGLFADERIQQSQLVAQYTGEVITMEECRERYCSVYSERSQVGSRPPPTQPNGV